MGKSDFGYSPFVFKLNTFQGHGSRGQSVRRATHGAAGVDAACDGSASLTGHLLMVGRLAGPRVRLTQLGQHDLATLGGLHALGRAGRKSANKSNNQSSFHHPGSSWGDEIRFPEKSNTDLGTFSAAP
ncbi:hypothetical protein [Oceanicola sp. S124]|uniref:hypothetical protein n=1 Tax=Oceanicola sp. S124 TaxID=1042378 RepID=UPI00110FDB3B|nr:hypothetical protein [Oceanicola sp. S124]